MQGGIEKLDGNGGGRSQVKVVDGVEGEVKLGCRGSWVGRMLGRKQATLYRRGRIFINDVFRCICCLTD